MVLNFMLLVMMTAVIARFLAQLPFHSHKVDLDVLDSG